MIESEFFLLIFVFDRYTKTNILVYTYIYYIYSDKHNRMHSLKIIL
jgi:hypothetical protein